MASIHKRKWTYNGAGKEAWTVRYFDAQGVRRSKQFDMKKSADAFARKVEREMEDGVHIPDAQTMTIEKASEEFLKHAERRHLDGRIGRSRLQALQTVFAAGIIPGLGRRMIRDLTQADVEELYRSLMIGRQMKPRSARTYIEAMKLLEAFAIKRGYLAGQPVTAALKELAGIPRQPIRTFRKEQVVHLLNIAGDRTYRRQGRTAAYLDAFVHLAAMCGLRRGEIMGLTVGSVDFDRRIVRVRSSLTQFRELKGPKSRAGVRDVPMPERVADRLRRWMEGYHVGNQLGLMFTKEDGSPYLPTTLTDSWTVLLKRAGLLDGGERFHFHALRHFYASMLISSGAPLSDAAKLMGHSTFDMTLQVYTHSVLQPEERHGLVETMVASMTALAAPKLPLPAPAPHVIDYATPAIAKGL